MLHRNKISNIIVTNQFERNTFNYFKLTDYIFSLLGANDSSPKLMVVLNL